jgi:hypothetical protein
MEALKGKAAVRVVSLDVFRTTQRVSELEYRHCNTEGESHAKPRGSLTHGQLVGY